MPKTARRLLGDRGEDIACQYYIDHGYEIVGRNVNVARMGEIDIIAQRTVGRQREIVFIEVKTRSGLGAGYGYEAINFHKKVRMRKCAMSWVAENIDRTRERLMWRLDVASIDMSRRVPLIRVFENIEI